MEKANHQPSEGGEEMKPKNKEEMKKVYLRVVSAKYRGESEQLDIFEGDIKEDKIYWEKYHQRKARYFKLVEKKK